MNLRPIFKNLVIVIAVILFSFPSPAALAAGNQDNQNQGNQALTQPAIYYLRPILIPRSMCTPSQPSIYPELAMVWAAIASPF
jgi:hypothetical protein